MVFDVLRGGHLVESGALAAASGVIGDGKAGEEVSFGGCGEALGGVAWSLSSDLC